MTSIAPMRSRRPFNVSTSLLVKIRHKQIITCLIQTFIINRKGCDESVIQHSEMEYSVSESEGDASNK